MDFIGGPRLAVVAELAVVVKPNGAHTGSVSAENIIGQMIANMHCLICADPCLYQRLRY